MISALPGALLRQWRRARHASQMDLAMKSQISQRHLSFLESGRARPSREMILRLSEVLDVPLRARNEILLAAGYAPHYPERPLESPDLAAVNQILQRMLEHHEPYPAMVLDDAWNIVMRNTTTAHLISCCVTQDVITRMVVDGKLNFLRLMCAPNALRPHIRSWPQTGSAMLARLRLEASACPGSASETLLRELLDGNALPEFTVSPDAPVAATIPLEIEVNGDYLRLLTTVTTFGTPQDVTLQGLRIEMSFPADEATERTLRRPRARPRLL